MGGLDAADFRYLTTARLCSSSVEEKKWVPTTKVSLIYYATPDFLMVTLLERLERGDSVTTPCGRLLSVF